MTLGCAWGQTCSSTGGILCSTINSASAIIFIRFINSVHLGLRLTTEHDISYIHSMHVEENKQNATNNQLGSRRACHVLCIYSMPPSKHTPHQNTQRDLSAVSHFALCTQYTPQKRSSRFTRPSPSYTIHLPFSLQLLPPCYVTPSSPPSLGWGLFNNIHYRFNRERPYPCRHQYSSGFSSKLTLHLPPSLEVGA